MKRLDVFIRLYVAAKITWNPTMRTLLSPGRPPTMFTRSVLVLIHLFVLTWASPPTNTQDQTIQLVPPGIHLPANISAGEFVGTNLNASNEIRIQCDGEKYGINPNVPDCENAKTFYKLSPEMVTYGERHSGHGPTVFPLPFRLMGDQALCYLEPVLADSLLGTGVASINQLANAAYELILQCAVRQSKGGIATRIGGRNMGLVLGSYRPNLQCRGTFGPWRSCRSVLADMPVASETHIFGPPDDRTVQIPLPFNFQSADGNCALRIFSTGSADLTSWYQIWEAVAAVYASCTRHSKGGSFRGLGEQGNIFFTMGARQPGLVSGATMTLSGNDSFSED